MSISEVLQNEENNKGSITLYKEGIFYKAYEVSAFIFITHVKQYAIKCKHYKIVDKTVRSLGFPASVLPQILDSIEDKEVKKHDYYVKINGFVFDENAFKTWKHEQSTLIKSDAASLDLKSRIIQFDVLNSSPLQCQQLIVSLKNEISNGTI